MSCLIGDYLSQKCKWYKKIGQDAFSKPIYATPVEIPCRFSGGMKIIRDKTGKEAVSQGNFIVLEDIGLDDKLEYDNKSFSIMNYSDVLDFDGKLEYRQVWV